MARAIGLLFSGASVKLAGAVMAYYVASYAWSILNPTLSAVSSTLTMVNGG